MLFAFFADGQIHVDTLSTEGGILLTDNVQDVVEIRIWRSRHARVHLDSIRMSRNWGNDLGRAMAKDGRMAIFQYGPPGTACMLRAGGLSPDHTELNFEGVSLNSLTLGMSDLSLLPTFFFDGAAQYQNPSIDAQNQSGIGSGVVLYSLERPRPNQLGYWSEISSLNNFSQGIQARCSFQQALAQRERFIGHHFEAKWMNQSFDNRFRYDVPVYSGNKEFEQGNNDVKQDAQWLKYRLDFSKSQVQIYYWRVNRNAELPTLVGQEYSGRLQTQTDLQDRLSVQWKLRKREWLGGLLDFSLGGFALMDKQRYQQVYQGQLTDDAQTQTSQGISFVKGGWSNNILSAQYRIQNRWVQVQYNSDGKIVQNIPSMMMLHQYKKFLNNWICSGKMVNQLEHWPGRGWINKHNIEFRGHRSVRRHEIEMSISPFYSERMPDFNERFWPGSGNPNLLQEKGRGIGGMINQSWRQNLSNGVMLEIFLDQDFTYRLVDNWIQWVPQSNGLWQPENWKYVEAKEWNSNLKFNIKKDGLLFTTSAGCQHLQNQSWRISQLEGAGEQLPYSPAWRWNAEQAIGWGSGYYAQCNWRYVGQRSMNETQDANAILPAVQLYDFQLGGPLWSMPKGCQWQLGCDNVLNIQYQEVKGYALPGRVWNVRIKFEINK